MDIYSLRLILDDLCMDQIDAGKIKRDSYYAWGIDELYFFVMETLYPNKETSIADYIRIVAEFRKRMWSFSKVRPKNNYMFVVAETVATDVIDILHAMEMEVIL